MGGLTVLYDEDCGFCTALARRLERSPGLRVEAIGSPAGRRLLRDLGHAERYDTVHVTDSSGRRHSGGAAVAPVLRALPGCRALAGACGRLPRATDAAYRLVARHRTLISRLAGLSAPTAGCRRSDPQS